MRAASLPLFVTPLPTTHAGDVAGRRRASRQQIRLKMPSAHFAIHDDTSLQYKYLARLAAGHLLAQAKRRHFSARFQYRQHSRHRAANATTGLITHCRRVLTISRNKSQVGILQSIRVSNIFARNAAAALEYRRAHRKWADDGNARRTMYGAT